MGYGFVSDTSLADTVDSAAIQDGAVAAVDIANGAVTTDKLAATAVTAAKIADGNVTRVKLEADIIDGTKLADDAVNSEHIADGAIDAVHLSSGAAAGNLTAGEITQGMIAADAINGAKLADDAVDSEHIADGAIDRVHLAADIVDGTKIADDAVDSEHIADGAIDAAHFAPGAVETAATADGSITTAKLANGAVTEAKRAALHHCEANHSSSASANHGTWTAVSLATEVEDTEGTMHSTSTNNSRVYAREAGLYMAAGMVSYPLNSTGDRHAKIGKNLAGSGGAAGAVHSSSRACSSAGHRQAVCGPVRLADGDYVELFAYQDSGGALTLVNTETKLTLTKIGP